MLVNAVVVLESSQKKVFGWQVESPELTFSAFFGTTLERALPSVSETKQYAIKAVYVGISKDLLDKVLELARSLIKETLCVLYYTCFMHRLIAH